jgi:hypothetical protein
MGNSDENLANVVNEDAIVLVENTKRKIDTILKINLKLTDIFLLLRCEIYLLKDTNVITAKPFAIPTTFSPYFLVAFSRSTRRRTPRITGVSGAAA